jgi:6-phosphofructokinase 1
MVLLKRSRLVESPWVSDDDLPVGYPFDYEKKIIEEYQRGKGRLSGNWIERGCPQDWPAVTRYDPCTENPLSPEIIGARRKDTARIVVDTRTGGGQQGLTECETVLQLTFPEAGPRERLRFPCRPDDELTVGVLVSGGIAPGINAVIASIVNRHKQYHQAKEKSAKKYHLTIHGYIEGLRALAHLDVHHERKINLYDEPLESAAELGGSLLRTSRTYELLPEPVEESADWLEKREGAFEKILESLLRDGVEILYVIGGDGSMKAAHAIWHMAQLKRMQISVVAIPKTMDNDILWVWQSFGFLSAVEKSREAILHLYTEATSNPRVGVIQLFGSDSGFVVSHAALASGVCDLALIPEVCFKIKGKKGKGVANYICHKLEERWSKHQSPHALIVMAETAIPEDAADYLNDPAIGLLPRERKAVKSFIDQGRRVHGQTPNELRAAGLKIVSRSLEKSIRDTLGRKSDYWKDFRVFANEPRHLIRSLPPSVSDVIFGQRLGALAVDNAMAGYTDFMVSQWLTEYVLVPLKLVVLGRKRMWKEGIFWKSVLASTGQPFELC